MLFQPSYPQPYFSDVDATQVSTFSCYINADSDTQVSAYRLKISTLGGGIIYDSGNITLETPLYGNQQIKMLVPSNKLSNGEDYTWGVDLYEDDADIWITSGIMTSFPTTGSSNILYLKNNSLVQTGMIVVNNNQRATITNIDTSNTDYLKVTLDSMIIINKSAPSYTIYDNKIQSNLYYFRARTTPVLTLNSIPIEITSKSYTFTATYTQAEGVGYKYFEWIIYDFIGNELDRSGKINVGEIRYTFDGFLNNTMYGVGLILENQDDITLEIFPNYFYVSYDLPSLENMPTAELICEKDAIKITWNPLLINNGEASNTKGDTEPWYSFVRDIPYTGGSSVNIHENSLISWNIGSEETRIDIPYESTTYFYWHTNNPDFSGVIYEQIGEYVNLLTMNTVAPGNASKGDKYYNTKDKLIYDAIDTNVWNTTGATPNSTHIYCLLSNNMSYIWNGADMVNTDYEKPKYTISYKAGKFIYNILNGDIDITGEIVVSVVENKWILQPQDITKSDIYQWDNTKDWDDALYWTESSDSYILDKWFKITLLPTTIQIEPLTERVAWNGDTTGLTKLQYLWSSTYLYRIADFNLNRKPEIVSVKYTDDNVEYSTDVIWLNAPTDYASDAYRCVIDGFMSYPNHICFFPTNFTYKDVEYPSGIYAPAGYWRQSGRPASYTYLSELIYN